MFLTPVVLTLAVAGPVFVDVAVNMIILFVDSGNPGDETTRAFAVPPSVPEKAIPPHADPASITFPDHSNLKQPQIVTKQRLELLPLYFLTAYQQQERHP